MVASDRSETMALADPQFSIVRVLRPFAGFEAVYDGQAASIPINMTEGGQPLDARAGTPGYEANLIAGVATPLGSRVLLWLPNISFVEGGGVGAYKWEILWRYRNTFDFRQDRRPYHYPKQGVGAPNTSGGGSQPRVVIPAANNTITYIQTEPAAAFDRAQGNVRAEDIRVGSNNLAAPLVPGGASGVIQQGVVDPAVLPGGVLPLYEVHEIQALGDEMILAVYRDTATVANWTFSGANNDSLFAQLFAAGDDVGVYVSVGVSP